jgi:hypothetical protein
LARLSQLSPTHRYWEICLTGENPRRRGSRLCSRVIGARVSRTHTATAHYFRSIALQSLGHEDRALRDLRRAYFTFGDLVFENENNTIARYGRGLSLKRMGHEQEAEQEMARATANSQGRASHFFAYRDGALFPLDRPPLPGLPRRPRHPRSPPRLFRFRRPRVRE